MEEKTPQRCLELPNSTQNSSEGRSPFVLLGPLKWNDIVQLPRAHAIAVIAEKICQRHVAELGSR